jgi:hypothetical protein
MMSALHRVSVSRAKAQRYKTMGASVRHRGNCAICFAIEHDLAIKQTSREQLVAQFLALPRHVPDVVK